MSPSEVQKQSAARVKMMDVRKWLSLRARVVQAMRDQGFVVFQDDRRDVWWDALAGVYQLEIEGPQTKRRQERRLADARK